MKPESIKSRWQKKIGEDSRLNVYGYAVAMSLSVSARADGTFSPNAFERPNLDTIAHRAKVGTTTVKRWLGTKNHVGELARLGYAVVVEQSNGRVPHRFQLILSNKTPLASGSEDVNETPPGVSLTAVNESPGERQPDSQSVYGHAGGPSGPLTWDNLEDTTDGRRPNGVDCPFTSHREGEEAQSAAGVPFY